jgi:hypothetical protein
MAALVNTLGCYNLGRAGWSVAEEKQGENVGCTLVLVLLGVIVWGLYYYFFTPDSEKLASHYNVPIARVYAVPKPHGCAYNDAPLGEKHCHYEKHITVYTKDGRVIEKDGSHLTECPSCAVWSVEQTWEKVEE